MTPVAGTNNLQHATALKQPRAGRSPSNTIHRWRASIELAADQPAASGGGRGAAGRRTAADYIQSVRCRDCHCAGGATATLRALPLSIAIKRERVGCSQTELSPPPTLATHSRHPLSARVLGGHMHQDDRTLASEPSPARRPPGFALHFQMKTRCLLNQRDGMQGGLDSGCIIISLVPSLV